MPVTSRGESTRERPGSIRPSKLSSRPTHSMPQFEAAFTTARITAFRPGASPPPVRTPRREMDDIERVYQAGCVATVETRAVQCCGSLFLGRLAQLGARGVRNAEVGSS